MQNDESIHRLAGSGPEKGGLVIMKKKKSDDGGLMAPPKRSALGLSDLVLLESSVCLDYFEPTRNNLICLS